VHALHLLQEYHVGVEPMQLVAYLVDDDPACQVGKTLVDVVGSDSKTNVRWRGEEDLRNL